MSLLRKIKDQIKRQFKARPIQDPARKYFEEVLIPSFGIFGVKNVLFVGVAPYTWHYQKLFNNQGIRFDTLDRRHEAATWGSTEGHYTCDIQDVQAYNKDTKYDLVVLMGIIGYGVNDADTVKEMLDAAVSILNPGGKILVACEEKFELDPVLIGSTCDSKLTSIASYGLPSSVALPDFDYGFHYLAPV